jgi:serine/threonine-protein kinase
MPLHVAQAATRVNVRPANESDGPPRSAVVEGEPAPALGTPEAAMLRDEIQRTQLFLRLAAILAFSATLVVAALSPGHRGMLFIAALCAATGVALLRIDKSLISKELLEPRRWAVLVAGVCLASAVAVYFFGFYSPAPMVGTFAIYFFGLARERRVAWFTYLLGASTGLVPSLLIAFGVIPDLGVMPHAASSSPREMLLVCFEVQVVYALTFWLARGSQRATRDAIEGMHAALVQVRRRDALLAEANLELDRALRGGQRGTHTGKRLGAFLLGNLIGQGAMGDVYEAVRDSDGVRAAVKVLRRELTGTGNELRRFLREAAILRSMASPHVVRFLDIGNIEGAPDGDPPFIAMELLEGHDLAWHLRREGRMSVEHVVRLVQQVAAGLEAAAALKIVHRDLKPQNIFLASDGEGRPIWKIVDFGLSRLVSDTHTQTLGAVVGTPGYMAPEQIRGGDVTGAADVFSLGVIAYRALTGQPAFAASDLHRLLFDVCYAMPSAPSELAPLSRGVEAAIAVAIAKNPGERFASASEFAAALNDGGTAGVSAEVLRRADALLARAPWGSRPPVMT